MTTVGAQLADRWLRAAAGEGSVRSLERGRAGAGRLVDVLRVEAGRVAVKVPDGRGRSHDVTVEIPRLRDDQWDDAVARCGAQVRHTAALLLGQLPDVLIDDDLLLPDDPPVARCACSQARPCRHEAAAHHAIAMAIQREPTRLLRLRGRSADELLAALRTVRSVDRIDDVDDGPDLADPLVARGDLDVIDVHPVPEPDVRSVLERLGPPPGFDDIDVVEGLMRDAAALAWRLAAGEGAAVADDEALLAELRAQGVATAGSIASSLGLEANDAQEALDRLYSAGTVLRMGEGQAARYRAA